jgi:hypothetical protein
VVHKGPDTTLPHIVKPLLTLAHSSLKAALVRGGYTDSLLDSSEGADEMMNQIGKRPLFMCPKRLSKSH